MVISSSGPLIMASRFKLRVMEAQLAPAPMHDKHVIGNEGRHFAISERIASEYCARLSVLYFSFLLMKSACDKLVVLYAARRFCRLSS